MMDELDETMIVLEGTPRPVHAVAGALDDDVPDDDLSSEVELGDDEGLDIEPEPS